MRSSKTSRVESATQLASNDGHATPDRGEPQFRFAREEAPAPLRSKKRPKITHALVPWQMCAALQCFSNEPHRSLALAAAAKACRLSTRHFSRAFKAATGVTPSYRHMIVRLAMAEQLMLSSDLPLVTIAVECGFVDQSHFTRAFKGHRGVAPSAWRRLQQKTDDAPPTETRD
jgi:transcriptional regulator GlxA family with amidase domain